MACLAKEIEATSDELPATSEHTHHTWCVDVRVFTANVRKRPARQLAVEPVEQIRGVNEGLKTISNGYTIL